MKTIANATNQAKMLLEAIKLLDNIEQDDRYSKKPTEHGKNKKSGNE